MDSNEIKPAKSKKTLIALMVGLVLAAVTGSYFLQGGSTFQGKIEIPVNGKFFFATVSPFLDSVKLDWSKTADATSYSILRADKPGKFTTNIGTTTENSYTDQTVVKNRTYYYQIQGKNSQQKRIWTSNELKVFIPLPLPAPKTVFENNLIETFVQVIDDNSSIKIKWNSIPGAVNYQVVEKNGSSPYSGSYAATGTDFTRKFMLWDLEKASYKDYTYYVAARSNDQKIGVYSNTIKATLVPGLYIKFPWSLEKDQTSIKVEWQWGHDGSYKLSDNFKITSYDLYRNDQLIKSLSPQESGFVDDDVVMDQLYEYKIVPRFMVSGTSMHFEATELSSGKTRICPAGTSLSISANEANCKEDENPNVNSVYTAEPEEKPIAPSPTTEDQPGLTSDETSSPLPGTEPPEGVGIQP